MDQKPPQIQPDPNLAAEETQANASLVTALQTQSQGDMASLMARYGTQLALANGQKTLVNNPSPATLAYQAALNAQQH